MKLFVMSLFVLSTAFIVANCGETKDDQPRVKIGVKKRIENCTTKTKKGDLLLVHYEGSLQDGTEFDNSYSRGKPFSFTLGSNQVIKGWDLGLMGMCKGEKRRLVIPPELGYGKSGSGAKIPPDSVLVFEVELVDIERTQEL